MIASLNSWKVPACRPQNTWLKMNFLFLCLLVLDSLIVRIPHLWASEFSVRFVWVLFWIWWAYCISHLREGKSWKGCENRTTQLPQLKDIICVLVSIPALTVSIIDNWENWESVFFTFELPPFSAGFEEHLAGFAEPAVSATWENCEKAEENVTI